MAMRYAINDVLLVKIEGPVWYTIYHHLPVVKGVCYTPLLINQPMGKGHLWVQLYHVVYTLFNYNHGQTAT